MQYICLSMCTLLDTDNAKVKEVPNTILEDAYRFTTANFEYSDVVKVLKLGPNPRGNKRKIYRTILGKELDIYGLIVEAIATNPPLMGLTIDDVKSRMDKLIVTSEERPETQQIRDTLNKLQGIINEKENIYRVFEWKDGMVYILDPLFLFYLRWGNH
jgi:16S rRNA C967 or C1407 C5-methylase (RsmB/RsmF family)